MGVEGFHFYGEDADAIFNAARAVVREARHVADSIEEGAAEFGVAGGEIFEAF